VNFGRLLIIGSVGISGSVFVYQSDKYAVNWQDNFCENALVGN
jgi:hypothetical protein